MIRAYEVILAKELSFYSSLKYVNVYQNIRSKSIITNAVIFQQMSLYTVLAGHLSELKNLH